MFNWGKKGFITILHLLKCKMLNGKWKMEKSNLVAIYHVRTSVCIETSGVDMFDLEIKK
jgi:hypothetical protein